MKLESEKEVIVFYKIKQDALERLFFFFAKITTKLGVFSTFIL